MPTTILRSSVAHTEERPVDSALRSRCIVRQWHRKSTGILRRPASLIFVFPRAIRIFCVLAFFKHHNPHLPQSPASLGSFHSRSMTFKNTEFAQRGGRFSVLDCFRMGGFPIPNNKVFSEIIVVESVPKM